MSENDWLPLAATPRTSNTSTPDQYSTSGHPKALERIIFDQEKTDFTPPNTMVAYFRNLPVREDAADTMETLFEQGFYSDGEQAPYLNEYNHELQEHEATSDVLVGSEHPPNNSHDSAASVADTTAGSGDGKFFLIEEKELKKLKVNNLKDVIKNLT